MLAPIRIQKEKRQHSYITGSFRDFLKSDQGFLLPQQEEGPARTGKAAHKIFRKGKQGISR